ncbi:hypothetical protein G4G28_19000 [Massilia sp. Dwa41.01b]|uniref:hypothetical protein n=1 Tax=Massilia sp. Dwa41.01b TaxID=2709302 RepID=UPI00160285F1|nr:hypothetical protein [Massilia sp. Dwa41.01b]QNA90058.1 hypothetical protein G4G28_19000 [Massilia sp. Dwa41.01b]
MTSPRLTSPPSPRSRLLAPLLYLVALLLLAEQWLWEAGSRFGGALSAWPPLRARNAVRALPPYWALLIFVLPGLLLFPVKLLALLAIAHGHPAWGVMVFVAAKLGGAVVVARIYVLTLPSLLALAWFARWHNRFIMFKDQLIARLRASGAYRQVRRSVSNLRHALRQLRRKLRPSVPFGSRHATRSARALRRFVALWRRRRKPAGSERP